MPLDTQVEALLEAAKKANVAELWQLSPDDARAEYRRRTERLKMDVDIHRFEEDLFSDRRGILIRRTVQGVLVVLD